MATYIAGLTDQILPPVLYQPDWNLTYQQIGAATVNWQRNKEQLESLWAEYFNRPMTNPYAMADREALKTQIDKKVEELSAYNLGDISVFNALNDTIGKVSELPHVVNDIKVTREFERYRNAFENLKHTLPTKENAYETYNPRQSEHLEMQRLHFATARDPVNIAGFKPYFPIHKDYDKIVSDYILESKAKIIHTDFLVTDDVHKNLLGERIESKYIVQTKDGIMTIPQWHKFIQRYLDENYNYREHVMWTEQADVHRRVKETRPEVLGNPEAYMQLSTLYMYEDVMREYEKLKDIERYENNILAVLREKKDHLNVELHDEISKMKNEGSFRNIDVLRMKEVKHLSDQVDNNIRAIEGMEAQRLRKEIASIMSNKKISREDAEAAGQRADEIKRQVVSRIMSGEVTYDDLLRTYTRMKTFTGSYDIARDYAMTHFAQKVTEDPFALAALRKRPVGGRGAAVPPPPVSEEVKVDYTASFEGTGDNVVISGYTSVKNNRKTLLRGTIDAIANSVNIDPESIRNDKVVFSVYALSDNERRQLDDPNRALSISPTGSTANNIAVKKEKTQYVPVHPYISTFTPVAGRGSITITIPRDDKVSADYHRVLVANKSIDSKKETRSDYFGVLLGESKTDLKPIKRVQTIDFGNQKLTAKAMVLKGKGEDTFTVRCELYNEKGDLVGEGMKRYDKGIGQYVFNIEEMIKFKYAPVDVTGDKTNTYGVASAITSGVPLPFASSALVQGVIEQLLKTGDTSETNQK